MTATTSIRPVVYPREHDLSLAACASAPDFGRFPPGERPIPFSRGNAAGAFIVMSSAHEHAGFDARFAAPFEPHAALGRVPARVARVDRDRIVLFVPGAGAGAAPVPARASGRLRHDAATAADMPAVGDWVAATLPDLPGGGDAVVHAVLPRHTCFARKAAGRAADEQVAAANVDTVFLVAGLDGDYNPRRIERYLVAARASGARAVVVLNKADLLLRASPAAYATRLAEVEELAGGAPVHAVSALAGDGLDALAAYLAPGQTVALLGSSGVGKSTLVNALAGEARQRHGRRCARPTAAAGTRRRTAR